MQKKIRHWKVIKSELSYTEATNIFKAQAIQGTHYDNLSIRVGDRQFFKGEVNPATQQYFPSELIYDNWEVLIPDTDEEAKCKKIRQLVKDSSCSGLTNAKIDNMTVPELFKSVMGNLSDDQKYRVLVAFYDQKMYKKTN